jgi:HD-like signal output (HDOD) protein
MQKKHILFIDSDDNVLSGLQRQLRPYREQWDQSFAKTGQEALALLDRKPIDLLISEVILADMSAVELLTQVKSRHPNVVRILLSAHTDENSLKNGLVLAHQYLSKPCTPEFLREAISQVFQIQSSLHNPMIIQRLGEAGQLPSLPKIYQELQKAIAQEVESKKISEIFAQDMVLSAKLLQLVNSPYFGLNRRISNLTEAINLIGVKKLSNLVVSAHIKHAFPAKDPITGAYIEYLWLDAARVSELAYRIALCEELADDRPDQSYLGGLLHNLGLLIFLSQGGQKLKSLIELAQKSDHPISVLEQEIFGFTRAEAATYLLSLWKIPPRIIEAVLLQHCPNNTEFDGANALTAVHAAASLLTPSHNPPYNTLFGIPLDQAYIQRLNKQDRLPKWQTLANEVAEIFNTI